MDALQFLAFNTATRSYVVLLQPRIQVLHKWLPSASASASSAADLPHSLPRCGAGVVMGASTPRQALTCLCCSRRWLRRADTPVECTASDPSKARSASSYVFKASDPVDSGSEQWQWQR